MTRAPARIQRKRTKGWRKPEGAVYVGRGSRWGNPYRAGMQTILTGKRTGEKSTQQDVVNIFRSQLEKSEKGRALVRDHLRGKDLMCWCPPGQPCHADVLLEIANQETP